MSERAATDLYVHGGHSLHTQQADHAVGGSTKSTERLFPRGCVAPIYFLILHRDSDMRGSSSLGPHSSTDRQVLRVAPALMDFTEC